MALGEAQQVVNVIRQAVEQGMYSGAKVDYLYGEVASSSGYVVSAYLNGNYESASEDFRVPAHLHINAGDYCMFAVDHANGGKWVVEVLPNSLYAKLSIDVNEGVLYAGDGTSPGTPAALGGSGNLDGGSPDAVYVGTTGIDGGTP